VSGISKVITVADDDVLHVSVSAPTHSFTYDMTHYVPDGNGGFQNGQSIGWGGNCHTQWLGKGSGLRGSLVKVCAGQSGSARLSRFEIIVRIQIERCSGVLEDCATIRIPPGLPVGQHKCLTFSFI
jgi:hypothetical protein